MKYIIRKGKHTAKPRRFGLWINERVLEADVLFTDSCKYFLDIENQFDTNKLFGIGYLLSSHTDSARVGWRYDTASNMIVLSAYCYVNGFRIIQEFAQVSLGKLITCKIIVADKSYNFEITIEDKKYFSKVDKEHKKIFSFPLNPYFGGNLVAPHDITINLTKH